MAADDIGTSVAPWFAQPSPINHMSEKLCFSNTLHLNGLDAKRDKSISFINFRINGRKRFLCVQFVFKILNPC